MILLKFLLFAFVAWWIFKSVARFFFGSMIRQAQQQQQQFQQQRNAQQTRPKDGNVNVQFAPKKKEKKSSENFKGGDYVEFEEVD